MTESLPNVTLVSLTGTTPYDATGVEWRRYEELCGPIDDEISVPELAQAKTLCPHQDFVYAVTAREPEAREIREHDEAVTATLDELLDTARGRSGTAPSGPAEGRSRPSSSILPSGWIVGIRRAARPT